MKKQENLLTAEQTRELLTTLQRRFAENPGRHADIPWATVEEKLAGQLDKLWSLRQMESTGGQPDVIGRDPMTSAFVFCDCSPETPADRRNLCYDPAALESRKANKPRDSALGMAADMGIQLLTEQQYRHLQTLGAFDLKTSSWVWTPDPVRRLGGALFCDRRYDQVFLYHNGAESYYAARGFRGLLLV